MDSSEVVGLMANNRATRPRLFKNAAATRSAMQNLGNRLAQETLDTGMKAVQQTKPQGIRVERKPKYLKLTEERLHKLGVIDLKPYFAKSKHRKLKKGGGWYLTVPIKLGGRKTKSTNRRLYEELRAVNLGGAKSKTIVSDYLYDRRRSSDATMLNYEPRTSNVTKIRTGKNRHDYVAFRTVSNKSPMSSWIINRGKVNERDTSKTFIRNVSRLIKWKMKNL
jgi:hypothetical protein